MVKGGVTHRILSDPVGSVRLVVNATTGTIAQQIDYDAFGNVLADTKPGFQPFGFAGGLADHDTGLVRFGARDYDPRVGRWTSKDPIRFRGQSTNLYEYSRGDPANLVDRTGRGSIGAAVAFAVGTACARGQASQEINSQFAARNALEDLASRGEGLNNLNSLLNAINARLGDPCLSEAERANLLANRDRLEALRDQILADLEEPARGLAQDSLRGFLTGAALTACSATGFAVGLALLAP